MKLGKLFIIATPIGNMKDITIRAIETLEAVDVLFCEDTRETIKLLNHYNLKQKLVSNNEKNEEKNVPRMLRWLKEGKRVGLVVDRGTPVISDPGFLLIEAAIKANYEVESLPGANAFLTVLPIAGFPVNNFLFLGFPDKKIGNRQKKLEKLKNYEYPLVFYETSRRIRPFLEEIHEILGDRKIIISREITKKHETHYRGTITEVMKNLEKIRGELVLIVAGNKNEAPIETKKLVTKMQKLVKEGKSKSEAVKLVAAEEKIEKNKLYKLIHQKKGE